MKETSLSLALTILSFMMTVIWGGPLIRMLRYFKIGKLIRIEGPDRHNVKMGTPTMGGVMIIIPVILLSVLLNGAAIIGVNVTGQVVILPIVALILYGILGSIDDWEGIRGSRRGLGMRARTKFAIQIILAIGIAVVLKDVLNVPQLFWPAYNKPIDLGIWFYPIAVFIIVASSNAVNFTDGLDGLAGLICVSAFAAYGGIALLQEQAQVASVCFTIVGAIFGFLWFNVHPAELFMGDAGSLALGAALGVMALMTGRWLLLPLIAIIPCSEVLSVIIQIIYFKVTKGKRFFKMAPLHHHFELIGWSETQVVQRFWLVSLMCAMLGIGLALV